jgi:hypothetical protein
MTATICEACWHLWIKHGEDGCHCKIYPSWSLDGEPCPCTNTEEAA